ncbi:2-dehydro-3-deoxy-6-phosphogalactonate aldolase [Rhodococcus sp. WMMA185]|uniref:2-dehydro-3-deoxy-6-phosphogalactonate aldolase n=1 Tax=Rhodococcus sp. WMMA185 TaxID=679318 RepID=UPI0008780EF5|nr:2-dehydro-3-deoxy-6-phosphogalactonate aldolase [Rhodococcus sp. WMMA185]AOW93013.1 2-dehydro-3-deoxy-6-phosphogalactonate aldolase [Rhodococcus sp. WMMA185]
MSARSTATPTGLIAILRGITPEEIVAVGSALVDAGFTAIEVPLNSPEPFESIERLAKSLGDVCVVGAGTVLSVDDVARAEEAGSKIIVSPNTDSDVIGAAVARNLHPYPGAATPTEAFRAVAAGARSIKLFPAGSIGTAGMNAWQAVLPVDVELLPVGGVDRTNLAAWAAAGARGAGLGSCLYRPGDSADTVHARAVDLITIWSASAESA